MKQSHLAELLGVGQASVSKWEGGRHIPAPDMLDALARFVAAPPQKPSDAILKRLVEQSARPIHLICDATHRLLAASRPRRAHWRLPEISGEPMWPFATPEIRRAEENLASIGWEERPDNAVIFETSGRLDPLVPIEPSTILRERLPVGDHGGGAPCHHAWSGRITARVRAPDLTDAYFIRGIRAALPLRCREAWRRMENCDGFPAFRQARLSDRRRRRRVWRVGRHL
jgi:transcriptional regulator with XRE-family HTH domain